jgi:hypothetical protein
MNILMMFGDAIGKCEPNDSTESTSNIKLANNPEFVDRGLKYIDEVTLVSEAARIFPSFLVPSVHPSTQVLWNTDVSSVFARLIRGRNLNQKYIRQTMASEIDRYRANSDVAEKIPVSHL